ncbi:MAG TPA: hypothetical protein VLK56_08600 [Solirubrobacterales bacterium]|nr:hypothetical protein [Solirubrobacterales bacterium]
MLSRLPVLEPIPKGIANALGAVALASIGLYFFFAAVPLASPELLRTIALIGASLLIAYVVEAVWLVSRVEVDDEYEEWLGFVTGAGIAGLLGVVFALLLAEHRAVGHSNFIDRLGTAWAAVSLLILAGVLVMQPLLAYRLGNRPSGERAIDDSRP